MLRPKPQWPAPFVVFPGVNKVLRILSVRPVPVSVTFSSTQSRYPCHTGAAVLILTEPPASDTLSAAFLIKLISIWRRTAGPEFTDVGLLHSCRFNWRLLSLNRLSSNT